MMRTAIDHSVYPDVDILPTDFATLEAQADFIARICGAWDFGIVPLRPTFALLANWRAAFDAYPVHGSAAYAALRSWFGWPPAEIAPPLRADYEIADARAGRPPDICRDYV